MKNNFSRFFENTIKHEGYYSNDPRDSGGETLFGVSRNNWPDWDGWLVWDDLVRKFNGDTPPRDTTESYLQKSLKNFYKDNFWAKVGGDKLPTGLDLLVSDMAVNSGVSRASRILQWVVGAGVDGQIGDKTIRAVKKILKLKGIGYLLDQYHIMRLTFYSNLNNEVFIEGWISRAVRGHKDAYLLLTINGFNGEGKDER